MCETIHMVVRQPLWLWLCCREAVLHWQAVGNPQCSGTWKKVQKTQQCNCPPQHSFVFIWSTRSTIGTCSGVGSAVTFHSQRAPISGTIMFRSHALIQQAFNTEKRHTAWGSVAVLNMLHIWYKRKIKSLESSRTFPLFYVIRLHTLSIHCFIPACSSTH